VKIIGQPQGNKKKYFAKAHKAVCKDVKRDFRVLQARFTIIRGQAHILGGQKNAHKTLINRDLFRGVVGEVFFINFHNFNLRILLRLL
jgi:hypothetical protein